MVLATKQRTTWSWRCAWPTRTWSPPPSASSLSTSASRTRSGFPWSGARVRDTLVKSVSTSQTSSLVLPAKVRISHVLSLTCLLLHSPFSLPTLCPTLTNPCHQLTTVCLEPFPWKFASDFPLSSQNLHVKVSLFSLLTARWRESPSFRIRTIFFASCSGWLRGDAVWLPGQQGVLLLEENVRETPVHCQVLASEEKSYFARISWITFENTF